MAGGQAGQVRTNVKVSGLAPPQRTPDGQGHPPTKGCLCPDCPEEPINKVIEDEKMNEGSKIKRTLAMLKELPRLAEIHRRESNRFIDLTNAYIKKQKQMLASENHPSTD
jgi:hypothetical protein